MFTVRVDHANGDGREVFLCARYRVSYGPGATLTLMGVKGQDTPESILLSTSDRAFVMNENGATIDQVWFSRRDRS